MFFCTQTLASSNGSDKPNEYIARSSAKVKIKVVDIDFDLNLIQL